MPADFDPRQAALNYAAEATRLGNAAQDVAMALAAGVEAVTCGLVYVGDQLGVEEMQAQEHADRVLDAARRLAEHWDTRPEDYPGVQDGLDELRAAVQS